MAYQFTHSFNKYLIWSTHSMLSAALGPRDKVESKTYLRICVQRIPSFLQILQDFCEPKSRNKSLLTHRSYGFLGHPPPASISPSMKWD